MISSRDTQPSDIDFTAQVRDAAKDATKPRVYVHENFIIWNGGQRLTPMLGQAVRLIAYNRANRKLARRS